MTKTPDSKSFLKKLLGALCACALPFALGPTPTRAQADDTLPRPVPVLEGVDVLDLAQTVDGVLWLVTDRGMMAYDGTDLAAEATRYAQDLLDGRQVTALSADPYRYLWLGTGSSGLMRFDGGQLVPASRPNTSDGQWAVTTLFQDSGGATWIGTPSDLLRLDGGDLSARPELPAVDARSIMEDPFGNVWVSVGSALFRRNQGVFQPIDLPPALSRGTIYDLAMDAEERLFVARDDGVLVLSGRFSAAGLPQSFERLEGIREARDLKVDPGGLWIGGETDGLWHHRPGRAAKHLPLGESEVSVRSILRGRYGNLWVASDQGLWRVALLKERVVAAAPRIVAVNVEGRRLSHGLAGRPGWQLPPGSGALRVELTTTRFDDADPTPLFRYSFGGGDYEWRAVDGSSLQIENLDVGRHLLKVQASFDGQDWGPSLEQEINLQGHFYQSADFRRRLALGLGLLVTVCGVMWLVLSLRRRHLERMLAEEIEEQRDSWRLEDLSPAELEGKSQVSAARHPAFGDHDASKTGPQD